MKTPLLLSLCITLALAASAKAQLRTQLGDVEDKRTTGDTFFGGLEVKIKLFGDDLADAESMRTVLKTAVDDTGRDLIDHEKERGEFEKVREGGGSNTGLTLRLKNPARKAVTIKEITGEVDLFKPKNDPDSIVTVENFQKTGGQPIISPALAAAGIEVTAYTREQADALKAKKEAGAKKKSKENIGEAISEAFGEMFDMGGGPNDITLQITDPNQKLVSVEFKDASGGKLKSNGTSSSGSGSKLTKTWNFHSKLPDTARLVLYISTPKAMVATPFSLKDVFLP